MRAWSQQDQGWVERYRTAMIGRHVPAVALEEREGALLAAVREAGVPAVELFGDAHVVAAEDAAELATAEEAVRTSVGGGLRPALQEVGSTLAGVGTVVVLLTMIRKGWAVDLYTPSALLAASLAVPYAAWAVCRALFSGGRPMATVGVLTAAVAVAGAGIAWAANLDTDTDHVVARDVPVPLLGLVVIAPGVLALLVARRLPPPTLREDWDDAEWLRRFRTSLRTRLVSSDAAAGHVEEVRQAIATGTATAFEEFGHPLVLAQQLADADRTARTRRWWLSVIAGTGTPLTVAALMYSVDSWGRLTLPLVMVFVLVAAVTALARWDERPWGTRG